MYNDTVIVALKEVGIKKAFVGGDTYITADSNPFILGRFGFYRYETFDDFRRIVDNQL